MMATMVVAGMGSIAAPGRSAEEAWPIRRTPSYALVLTPYMSEWLLKSHVCSHIVLGGDSR